MGLFGQKKHTVRTENLQFSRQEMAAIIQIAGAMAGADGEAHPNEKKMMINEAKRFNIDADEFSSLLNMFDESVFPYTDEEIEDKSLGEAAIAKRFAECGYLTDGDISDDIKSMIEGNLNAAEETYYSLPLGNSLLRKLLGLSGISGILDGDKDGKADKLTNIGTVNWKKY